MAAPTVTKRVFKRRCAYSNCNAPFTTTDPRKLYHTKQCGQNARQQRYFRKTQKLLRAVRKAGRG